MSEAATEQQVETPQVEVPSPPVENLPPYHEQLNSLPEDVRPLVEPVFKDWDAKTTQRNQEFRELQSQFEPWKDVITDAEPEFVSQAMQLAQLLDENPKALFDYLKEVFKFDDQGPVNSGDGNNEPPVDIDEDDPIFSHPKFKEMQETLEAVGQILVGNQQQATLAEQNKMLEEVISSVADKPGYDEEYFLFRLSQNDSPEEALAKCLEKFGPGESVSSPAPIVAPANGGSSPSVTNGGKRLGELSNQETENAVIEILKKTQAAAN